MLPRLGTLWAPTGLAEWDIATIQLFNRGDDSVNSRFLSHILRTAILRGWRRQSNRQESREKPEEWTINEGIGKGMLVAALVLVPYSAINSRQL
jgi:hypothetical protein